jgi:hypothetical protein
MTRLAGVQGVVLGGWASRVTEPKGVWPAVVKLHELIACLAATRIHVMPSPWPSGWEHDL